MFIIILPAWQRAIRCNSYKITRDKKKLYRDAGLAPALCSAGNSVFCHSDCAIVRHVALTARTHVFAFVSGSASTEQHPAKPCNGMRKWPAIAGDIDLQIIMNCRRGHAWA